MNNDCINVTVTSEIEPKKEHIIHHIEEQKLIFDNHLMIFCGTAQKKAPAANMFYSCENIQMNFHGTERHSQDNNLFIFEHV